MRLWPKRSLLLNFAQVVENNVLPPFVLSLSKHDGSHPSTFRLRSGQASSG